MKVSREISAGRLTSHSLFQHECKANPVYAPIPERRCKQKVNIVTVHRGITCRNYLNLSCHAQIHAESQADNAKVQVSVCNDELAA